jgi:hypothetical protein
MKRLFTYLFIFFFIASCVNEKEVPSLCLPANDQTLCLVLQNGFILQNKDSIGQFFGRPISENYWYKNAEDFYVTIGIEKKLGSKPLYYLETGGDELFYTNKRNDIVKELLIENLYGNYKNVNWKENVIKQIAEKQAIYLHYEHDKGEVISVLWFTDDLFFVKMNYFSHNNTKLDLDLFKKMISSIKWESSKSSLVVE